MPVLSSTTSQNKVWGTEQVETHKSEMHRNTGQVAPEAWPCHDGHYKYYSYIP
jgi:hypothetical protein